MGRSTSAIPLDRPDKDEAAGSNPEASTGRHAQLGWCPGALHAHPAFQDRSTWPEVSLPEEAVQETGLAEKPQKPNTYRNAYEIRQDCATHKPVMGCHALVPVGMIRSGNARAVSVRTRPPTPVYRALSVRTCPLPSVHDAPTVTRRVPRPRSPRGLPTPVSRGRTAAEYSNHRDRSQLVTDLNDHPAHSSHRGD